MNLNDKTEETVLGTLLSYPNAYFEFADVLKGSFYKSENEILFETIEKIAFEGDEVNEINVLQQIKKDGNLKKVPPFYVMDLPKGSINNLETLSLRLKEQRLKRDINNLGLELSQIAVDDKKDIFDTLDYLNDRSFEISTSMDLKKQKSNAEVLFDITTSIQNATKEKGITGVPTGFDIQDNFFGGWQKSNLIILAARPGMGKTAKALIDAKNAVIDYNKRVIFFSLEMSNEQLLKRLICTEGMIDNEKLKRGNLNELDWENYNEALAVLENENLILVDDCYSIREIINRIKKERLKGDIDMIVIDYLQLIEGKGFNKEDQVSRISRRCKKLSKEMDCPVIALSQLSRKCDDRAGGRPQLSDLRDSGAIEQDADVVVFMYRPEYYGITSGENGEDLTNKAFGLVAKNRNGGLIDLEYKFNGKYFLFQEDLY